MFAAQQKFHQVVNFLSVRTSNLNLEDTKGISILLHQVLQKNFKLSSRLIYRGAEIDMVNKFGKTALHYCVEMKLKEAVEYLLYKGANQHILDLDEKDCCDKAKFNGLALEMLLFNNCTLSKKIKPKMPDGSYPKFVYGEFYQKQKKKESNWEKIRSL